MHDYSKRSLGPGTPRVGGGGVDSDGRPMGGKGEVLTGR